MDTLEAEMQALERINQKLYNQIGYLKNHIQILERHLKEKQIVIDILQEEIDKER